MRGRAKCCDAPLDSTHFKLEWAAASIGGVALAIDPSFAGLALGIFGWLLLPLFVLDRRHFWLPDRLVLITAIGGVPLGGLVSETTLASRAISALVAGSSLMLIGLAYRQLRKRDGLGGGDPKLLTAITLWIGPHLALAALLGATIVGLAEALLKRRGAIEPQPFGAYLCVSAWLATAYTIVWT